MSLLKPNRNSIAYDTQNANGQHMKQPNLSEEDWKTGWYKSTKVLKPCCCSETATEKLILVRLKTEVASTHTICHNVIWWHENRRQQLRSAFSVACSVGDHLSLIHI